MHGFKRRMTRGIWKAGISRAGRVVSALALVMNVTAWQGLVLLLLPWKGWEVGMAVGKEHFCYFPSIRKNRLHSSEYMTKTWPVICTFIFLSYSRSNLNLSRNNLLSWWYQNLILPELLTLELSQLTNYIIYAKFPKCFPCYSN